MPLLDDDVSRRRRAFVEVVECDAALTADASNRQPTRYEKLSNNFNHAGTSFTGTIPKARPNYSSTRGTA
jgi:hypothetical protein